MIRWFRHNMLPGVLNRGNNCVEAQNARDSKRIHKTRDALNDCGYHWFQIG